MDEVAENSDALMERYLEGEEISHEEIVAALKEGTNHGGIFPVTCGVATRNLGTNRLLDAIVEDLPSPVKHGGLELAGDHARARRGRRRCSPTSSRRRADPFAGRINLFRVYQGTMRPDSHVLNTRAHAQGAHRPAARVPRARRAAHADEFGPGDIGAVAKLKETHAGDWLADRDEPIADAGDRAARAGDGVRDRAQDQGRRGQGLHRAAPPAGGGPDDRPAPRPADRRADRRRPLAGARRGDRRPPARRASAPRSTLKPPRVPYQETIRGAAKAHGRHKKQTGGRGQFGDCHIEIEPLATASDFEFVNEIKGGVIPTSFIPAVEKGVREAMQHGAVAGYPVKGVRVRLVRRLLPLGRLLGDGVQDRRLAWRCSEALEQAEPGAARADHARHAVGARGHAWAT